MDPHSPKPDTQDQRTDSPGTRAAADGDGDPRDERYPQQSSAVETPSSHPADATNQPEGVPNFSSKSDSGSSSWFSFGATKEQVAQLQHQVRAMEDHIEQLNKHLASREKEYRGALAEKDGELAELKKTLCMYDECSEVEVGNMVDGINTRIQSFARNLAVRWGKDASKMPDGVGSHKVAEGEDVDRLTSIIGIELANALKDANPRQNRITTLFLQLAWQAAIVSVVEQVLLSFSASLLGCKEGPDLDRALHKISNAVRQGEVQPAFGRWRLITHQYLNQVLRTEDGAIRIYVDRALGLCYTACILAMKDCCPDVEPFMDAFQVQTKEIVEAAFKLLTIIQEKMVTTNYEPYTLKNGRTFRPENMVIDKQDQEFEDDRVVCTTGLGLRCSRKRGRENTLESPHKDIFKKPQVLTVGNLSDLVAD